MVLSPALQVLRFVPALRFQSELLFLPTRGYRGIRLLILLLDLTSSWDTAILRHSVLLDVQNSFDTSLPSNSVLKQKTNKK